jgi:predicted O-methyltransferase YrrM
MNTILKEIFESKSVQDANGARFSLHSNTSIEQCLYIDKIMQQIRPEICIEIGLAYGVSALQILDSMGKFHTDFKHIIIDPYQDVDWKGIGLLNIDRAGYKNRVDFYQQLSDQVLPTLYIKNTKIDFAYVDSTKVFDTLMVDVFYITKMLNIGGVIILDDCDFPGIRMLVRFMAKHPSLEIVGGFNKDVVSLKGRIAGQVASFFLKNIPLRKRKLSRINIETDEQLKVNFKCIAFKKIAEDTRNWDWHQTF